MTHLAPSVFGTIDITFMRVSQRNAEAIVAVACLPGLENVRVAVIFPKAGRFFTVFLSARPNQADPA
jgi:hypothetical protein